MFGKRLAVPLKYSFINHKTLLSSTISKTFFFDVPGSAFG